jgi:DNA-binding NarL/FixJ family response regulator
VNADAPPLRVVVADDQQIVRDGLATILDLLPDVDVIAAVANGVEALEAVVHRRPDVVLMDLNMPEMNGVEATRRIVAEHPDTAVLVLTTYADEDGALEALRAGARGLLTKDAGRDEIARALHQAAAGHITLAASVQARSLASSHAAPAGGANRRELPDGITPREAEVLALIAHGLTNREIAEHLVVSETTVKSHINHLFAKTGARDRAAAINYAHERGLAAG